jgi:hypothetical protein
LEHPSFLADGACGYINTTEPKQLLLPGFLLVLFFCIGIAASQKRPTKGYVAFSISV